jgi:6-pyruvoyltetrahydropterin/6-carboxytetrahydropterin synthase
MVAVTKRLTFDVSHYLINKNWSIAKNREVFHKCSLYKYDGLDEPHGHTYHMEVTVLGMIDPNTGFVIDFKELKRILKDGVVERMDHRLLNNIPYFKDKSPTVENMLYYVWDEICPQIDNLRPEKAWLESIRIWETPNSFATLTRKMKFTHEPDCGCDQCQRERQQFLRSLDGPVERII